jgi:glutathione S-transferase
MGDVFIWKIFNEACIKPAIWKLPRDTEAIRNAVAHDLPDVMDYLESVAPGDGFAFGAISIADISVAVFFRNLRWSRIELDRSRWPSTLAWVDRTENVPELNRLSEAADRLLRTPPAEAGAELSRLGFAIVPETMGGEEPRPGPMSVR